MGRSIVAGSINVDLIVGVARLPAAGETVLGDRFVQQNGGKSANQAVAASRVGATVVMLGAVGEDDLGRSALDGLASEGVDVSACRRLADEHTGLALIVVDAAGENQIAVAQGANMRLDAAMIRGQTADLRPPPEPSASLASRSRTRPSLPPRAGLPGGGCASSSTRRPLGPCWTSCSPWRPS